MDVFPVYCFDQHGQRIEVFMAFDHFAAHEFAIKEKWDWARNGFYLGRSRKRG